MEFMLASAFDTTEKQAKKMIKMTLGIYAIAN